MKTPSLRTLKFTNFQVAETSLLCDVACGITRPFVPVADRPAVCLHIIHTMGYPGIFVTSQMVSACFVWKVLGKDVPEVQVWKGPQAANSFAPHHPSSGTQILPRTRGPI